MKSISNDLHRSDADIRNDILEEVRNHLSQMKPDIISSIAEEVLCRIDNLYASRIERLEDRISELERRISDAQKTPVRQKTSTGVADTAKKIDTSRIHAEFRFDGWIYYRNGNMGNFLYRVREDGSENTQLTDFSVSLFTTMWVEGGYLYFEDERLKERKLKLS